MDADAIFASLSALRPRSYAALVEAIYCLYAERHGIPFDIWGDKNNSYVNRVAEILELFPDARFLFVVRDGRDVACSYRELNRVMYQSPYAPRLPIDIEAIASQWKENNLAAVRGFAEIEPTRVTHLRYEDLVASPVEWVTRICSSLHLEFDQAMMCHYESNPGQEPPSICAWKGRIHEPPHTDSVSRYRRELSTQEAAQFEAIAGDMLKALGYE